MTQNIPAESPMAAIIAPIPMATLPPVLRSESEMQVSPAGQVVLDDFEDDAIEELEEAASCSGDDALKFCWAGSEQSILPDPLQQAHRLVVLLYTISVVAYWPNRVRLLVLQARLLFSPQEMTYRNLLNTPDWNKMRRYSLRCSSHWNSPRSPRNDK